MCQSTTVHAGEQQKTEAYQLGIFPYMPPRQTVKFYGPIAADMEKTLQTPIRLESQRSFSDFTQALAQHAYDIALIQPFDYPKAVDKFGYIPLARVAEPLRAHFYVRVDSLYHSLQDLRDTTIAMPPAKAANSRMALRALYDNHLIPGQDVTIRYFNSHDSCLQQVWLRNASACATSDSPVVIFEKRMKARLRSIYDMPPIPHILFIVSPKVPLEKRELLKKLIISWGHTQHGKTLLKNLGFPAFVPVKPNEYRIMNHYEPMSAVASANAGNPRNLVLGIFPYLSSRQLIKNFAPLLPAISRITQMPVQLRTASSFGSFTDSLDSGKYDIVLVQPYEVEHAIKLGYRPLAQMQEQVFGAFYVRNDSRFNKIADLKGQTIAMAPFDSAQSHLGRHALYASGLFVGKNVTVKYVGTHDACLRAVQRGAAAACATSPLVIQMLPKTFSAGLHRIGKTQNMPGVMFLAHQRLPQPICAKLEKEIISWQHTAYGHKILNSMKFGSFVRANLAEYKNLSELGN